MKYYNKIKSYLSNAGLSDVGPAVIGAVILLGVAYGNTLAEVLYVTVSLLTTLFLVYLSVLMFSGYYSIEVAKERKEELFSRKSLTRSVVMFFITFYLVNTGGAFSTALAFILFHSSVVMLHIATYITAKKVEDDTTGTDYQGE